jgi:hypothetical protein
LMVRHPVLEVSPVVLLLTAGPPVVAPPTTAHESKRV